MAKNVGALEARLSADSAQFVEGMEKAARATNRMAATVEKGLGRAETAVKGLAAAYAADRALDAADQYLQTADANKKMEASTKLATAQFGNQAIALSDIKKLSKETRSGLEEITDLYTKFLPTSKELGKSQDDNKRAVETFSKALKVGGADQQQSASATLQMGQALSSANVQWEELGQILEASPRLGKLFTDSLGVTRGELKKMAEDGKLSSEMLYKALTDKKFTDQIDAEFKELPATFDQAKVLISNALTEMIGEFDRGSGISDSIVDAMSDGEASVESLTSVAHDKGAEIRADFEGLEGAFKPLLDDGMAMFDLLGVRAVSFAEQMRSILSGVDQVRNMLPDLQRWGQDFDKKWFGFNTQPFTGPAAPRSTMEADFNRARGRDRLRSSREDAIRVVRQYERDFTGKDKKGNPISNKALEAKLREVEKRVRSGAYVVRGTGVRTTKPTDDKGGGRGGANKAAREAEKAQREAEREAERARRNLEAFENDRARLQLTELDSRADLASVGEERFAFERQALDMEKKQRLAVIEAEGPNGDKRYTQAQVDELKALEEKIALNKGEAINAKEAQFVAAEKLKIAESGLDNAIELAGFEADMARSAKERRAAEYRLLDLRMEQEKLALEAVLASKESTKADKEAAKARLALLPRIRAGEAKGVDQRTMGPLEAYLDAIPRGADEINESLERVQVKGLDNLRQGIKDAITDVGDLGDAFANMASSVVDGLLDIAIQQTLIKPLGSLLFGGESGGGGLLGSIVKGVTGAVVKGGKANGGIGNGGTWRVGEHGPENVTIPGPFSVTPTHKLKDVQGGAGSNVNVTFGSITSNDPAAMKAAAVDVVFQTAPLIVEQAKKAVRSDLGRPRMT